MSAALTYNKLFLLQPRSAAVAPGYCVRISTGAPVPAGADAVVKVEDTKLTQDADDGRTELEIDITDTPQPGQSIRSVLIRWMLTCEIACQIYLICTMYSKDCTRMKHINQIVRWRKDR